MLRYLASIGMIKETGKDSFAATNITEALASPGNQAGVCHYFDTVGPQFQALPKFLAEHGYRNITDDTKTVFHDAWKTELPNFVWLSQHPQNFDYLNRHMAARRKDMPTWLSVYPVEEQVKEGWNPRAPIYIDIGGGIGHQCAEFKAKYPNLTGRVILQDLSHSIDSALSTSGVENLVHDFFKPQPFQGELSLRSSK